MAPFRSLHASIALASYGKADVVRFIDARFKRPLPSWQKVESPDGGYLGACCAQRKPHRARYPQWWLILVAQPVYGLPLTADLLRETPNECYIEV